jgi:hypothetical protein
MERFITDMSLKAVHLVFVSLLTMLAFGCAAWAFAAEKWFFGAAGVAAGVVVIFYGIYFLKKLKRISYL